MEWFSCFLDAADAPASDQTSGPAADRAEWLSVFLAASSRAPRSQVARSSLTEAVKSRAADDQKHAEHREQAVERKNAVAREDAPSRWAESEREEQAHAQMYMDEDPE